MSNFSSRSHWLLLPAPLPLAMLLACGEANEDGITPHEAKATSSSCLSRSAAKIKVIDAKHYDDELELSPPGVGYAYDMRGAEFDYGPPKYSITVRGNQTDTCVVGPRIVGQQSPDLTWDQLKDKDDPPVSRRLDGNGVRFRPSSFGPAMHSALEGAWMENVMDGLEPPRYSNDNRKHTWSLKHSYFRRIRDDVVENDLCLSGEVNDVLVDQSFMFLAMRPGKTKYLDNAGFVAEIKIHNTLVHIAPPRAGGKVGKLFKLSGGRCNPEPRVDVRDTIFRVDKMISNMEFPEGTYKDVTLVLPPGVTYPAAIPSGVEVTHDISVWHAARADWLARHGCDIAGNNCTGLLNGSKPAGDGTWEARISSSSDDAEERASGRVYLRSSDLEMVQEKSLQTVGLRFRDVAVPKGAVITRAYLQFTTDEATTGEASLQIRAEDVDNAAPFTTALGNLSARATTALVASWAPQAWTAVGAASEAQRSPDLAAVIQAVVDRSGWASGNALAIIVVGDGKRVAESFDGSPEQAPQLHIEYSQ